MNIHNIRNFYFLSDLIATAGQPTKPQFYAIENSGYEVVINLAVTDSPEALPLEKEIAESYDLVYYHIPVIWNDPSLSDLWKFFDIMQKHSTQKIFVHCIANKRVSAFIYLYRILKQSTDIPAALHDLNAIWTPNTTWKNFIDTAIAEYRE